MAVSECVGCGLVRIAVSVDSDIDVAYVYRTAEDRKKQTKGFLQDPPDCTAKPIL